ncbi:hypothetical protein [Catenuloplanes japonicus]|uniref:hypothetical protein n=1 Tax=Catenuloplanes japonicus TaxID=33876 RepID=UPI000525F313|nr:hypothetical protein [Catenuloplanes japonicus]
MSPSDVNTVVNALRRNPFRRVAVVPRDPGPRAAIGLAMFTSRLIADRQFAPFGTVSWLRVDRAGDDEADEELREERLPGYGGHTVCVVEEPPVAWLTGEPGVPELVVTTAVPHRSWDAVVIQVASVEPARAARRWLTYRLRGMPPGTRTRLEELAVLPRRFGGGEPGSHGAALALWQATAGMPAETARDLLIRLAARGLIEMPGDGLVSPHPVARAIARHDRPAGWFADLAGMLLDTVDRPWWELPPGHYLWENLIAHLCEAGRDASAVATDLRWITARLAESGPLGPLRDLVAACPGSVAERRYRQLLPHLGDGGEDTLLNLVRFDDGAWGAQAHRLQAEPVRPILVSRWMPVLLKEVRCFAVDRRGSRIVVITAAGRVSVVDGLTGERRWRDHQLGPGTYALTASPDGGWFAAHRSSRMRAGLYRGELLVWDEDTVLRYRRVRWLRHPVTQIAASLDFTVVGAGTGFGDRYWDWTTREARLLADVGRLTPWSGPVGGAPGATSPDGRWHAYAARDGLRLRDGLRRREGPWAQLPSPPRWIAWLPGPVVVACAEGYVAAFALADV